MVLILNLFLFCSPSNKLVATQVTESISPPLTSPQTRSLSVFLNQVSSLSLIPFSISVAYQSYKHGKHAKCESSYRGCMSKIQFCFVDKAQNCASNISISYFLMSLLSPEGKYWKKKSNHSRDTADLQLRNNARSQCVVIGRWKYTYIWKKKKSFQMQQNKKAEIFQLSELVTVNNTGETPDIKWRIQFSGSGSTVSHVGWDLIQISIVFIRLEKDTKFTESCFGRVLYLGVPVKLCYWNCSWEIAFIVCSKLWIKLVIIQSYRIIFLPIIPNDCLTCINVRQPQTWL